MGGGGEKKVGPKAVSASRVDTIANPLSRYNHLHKQSGQASLCLGEDYISRASFDLKLFLSAI